VALISTEEEEEEEAEDQRGSSSLSLRQIWTAEGLKESNSTKKNASANRT
jgi:hypothetical protein